MGICPKVNAIARLEFELAYYDSAVHRFNHYTTRTPPLSLVMDLIITWSVLKFQKVRQIMLLHDVVDEVPVFGCWVHPVLVDLLELEVGIGNDQLVFCTDR